MARVLVVDDVAVNRELVITLLRYAGHELAEARDGEDALAQTRAFRPHLVVCDILMPRMDGYEFVRRLRDESAIAGTAVVFYTASFLEKEARMLAYACGVLNVITKPCEPQEILAAVASALAHDAPPVLAPEADPEFDRDHLRLVTDKLAEKAQELEQANGRLAALIDLGVRLASEHGTHSLLDHFCDGVRRLFGARLVLLCAREADGSQLHMVVHGDAGEWAGAIAQLQSDLALESKETSACRFDAEGGDPALRAKVLRHCPDARCALLAPVVSLRSHYGWVLLVDQLETGSFNRDDQRTLAVQAAQVGRFYENGNLYAQVQQQVGLLRAQAEAREREAALLRLEHNVARALVAADTTDSALTTVLQAICESQRWDIGRFWQVDEAADVLRLAVQWHVSSVHLPPIAHAQVVVLKPGEGLAGRVWRTGEPLFVADLRADRRLTERAVLQIDGLICATMFPVGSGGRVFGVLSFLGRRVREPDARMQASARVIGDQIGQFLQRRDAQDAVQAGKKFIRSTLDSLLEHVCVIDSTGVILTVNRAWRAFAQAQGQQSVRTLEGSNYLDACADATGEAARETRAMAAGIRSVIDGQQPTFTMEYACDMPGQVAWFAVRVSRFADDGPVRVVVAHENITDRKLAEQRIERLHRVSTVMSDINALILRVQERDDLFQGACRIAIDTGSFKMAWVGVLSGEPLRVDVVAADDDGSTSGYFDNLREELQAHVTTNSPQFKHLAVQQQPIVVNDIAATPWMALREASLLAGARSAVVLPIVIGTVTRGLMMLYADEADFFDDDEIKLLRQLAGDLAFAMNHLHQAEQLNHLAYYDALTGHANGMLFGERVTQFLEAARGTRLAIGVVDIERFKSINDVWGRHAGDDLLRQVAARLLAAVGERSRLARVGPDQFGVVIQNAPQGIELLRTLDDLYQSCFGDAFACAGTSMRAAAHVGVALYPEDGGDAETLFRNAEAAVKRAKRSSERVLLYDPQVGQAIAAKVALEMRLRDALERRRFVLHYQPKVDARTRRIVGVEALIRWQDPELGLVSPLTFIPLMEETGLIVEVGAWALRQAVEDRRGWIDRGLVAPNVAVNVSAVQLRKSDFVDAVLQVLGDGGGNAGIDLEITESAAMEDVDDTIAKLERLRTHGIVLAIDDFGTGYSSLAYLSKLPAQVLKIDRAFVSTMNADPNAMTLVSTMVSLAHAMRMEVVAEGVETQQQADTLCAMQCDQLQGYLISRPLPEPVFALLLDAVTTRQDDGA